MTFSNPTARRTAIGNFRINQPFICQAPVARLPSEIMIKIVKFLVTLIALASACYFAFFVPLGSKTFYEHLKGISKTEEAQKFQDEITNKVKETARVLSNEFQSKSRRFSATDKDSSKTTARKSPDAEPKKSAAKPISPRGEGDRQAALNVIREKSLPSADDQASLKQLVREKINPLAPHAP